MNPVPFRVSTRGFAFSRSSLSCARVTATTIVRPGAWISSLARLGALAGLVCAFVLAGTSPDLGGSVAAQTARGAKASPQAGPRPLDGIRSWGYQLQQLDIAIAARSPFDLMVIDYSRNGEESGRYSRAQIQRLKRKPDGSRRLVIAYLSVGEAEDYRFYWDERWIETATPEPAAATGASAPSAAEGVPGTAPVTTSPAVPAPPSATVSAPNAATATPAKPDRWLSPLAPPWLGDENDRWSGNYQVKYWEPAWQAIVFGSPLSYLERLIEQGFDGVYLDRVDAYYEFNDERPSAADDMASLVIRLAARARSLAPEFLVIVQNGEELLLKPPFVQAIDGIAKEDLLYGSPDEGVANSAAQIANSDGWLGHAARAGRRVLVVEYLDKPDVIATARAAIEARGFVPYFAPRSLDRLVNPPPLAASPKDAPARQRR